MAFYEYRCETCNEVTEKRFSISGEIPQEVVCSCGGKSKRVFGGHQINMNYRIQAMQAYDKLPEYAKTGDTSFLRNESKR